MTGLISLERIAQECRPVAGRIVVEDRIPEDLGHSRNVDPPDQSIPPEFALASDDVIDERFVEKRRHGSRVIPADHRSRPGLLGHAQDLLRRMPMGSLRSNTHHPILPLAQRLQEPIPPQHTAVEDDSPAKAGQLGQAIARHPWPTDKVPAMMPGFDQRKISHQTPGVHVHTGRIS